MAARFTMQLLVRRSFPATMVRGRAARLSTVASVLDERCQMMPTKDVLRVCEVPGTDVGIRWSLSDVKIHSEALACGLLQLGCATGDTIAVLLPNNAEHVAVTFAAAKAGLVVAEVEGTPTAESLAAVLDATKCSGIIVDGKDTELVAMLRGLLPETERRLVAGRPQDYYPYGLPGERFPALNFVVHTGMKAIKDDFQRPLNGMYSIADILMYNAMVPPFESIAESVSPDSPFLQQLNVDGDMLTSPSPPLTHGQVLERSEATRAKLGFGSDDKVCLATNKDAAIGTATVACIQSFAQLVVPSPAANDEKIAEASAAEGCKFTWA